MSTTIRDPSDDEEGATQLLIDRPLPRIRRVECKLGRRLGSGGYAEVYEAEIREPETQGAAAQRGALKRLLPGMRQDPVRRRLLAREAHLAAQLEHRNIVQVLDLLDLGDELAILMELVDGLAANHLLHRLAQRSLRLTLGSVTHVMQGLFSALSYLENPPLLGHRPLVHSDISLENVMVTASGEVKLLDFGIAGLDQSVAAPADEEGLTSIHQVAGKRSYSPPEGGAAPTVAGDLYAAGVCFWELIAGCRFPVLPRGVSSREMGSLIAFAAEGLPEGVWTTLKLCLSIDPAFRPATASGGSELLGAVGAPAPFRQDALAHVVRCILDPGSSVSASMEEHPDWLAACEPYDVVASLVERLQVAFCAHRVLAYEPVPPEEINNMGGHEFVLRCERGGGGEALPEYRLHEALDGGYREIDDGTLLFRIRPPGAQSHILAVQPGRGCVYDLMARKILHSLLRPEAPLPEIW